MTEIVSKADLIGRTALVTGSSRGIGLAVALELAAAGAQVAVHGRSAHGAADVAARLSTHGRHAGTFPADFAEQHAAERFVANVTASLPALDIVVLVAGVDVLTGAAAKWDFQRKLAALLAVDVAATMTLTRGFGRWIGFGPKRYRFLRRDDWDSRSGSFLGRRSLAADAGSSRHSNTFGVFVYSQ